MSANFTKDPDAVLDYATDWAAWLPAGDTIATSSWTITGPDSALVIGTGGHAPSTTTTVATVWLSGGTLDKTYTVTNHVTTAQGRITDRTLLLNIRQQ